MTNDLMPGGVYLLMAAMVVVGALINRREPFARLLKAGIGWIAVFGAGFVIFSFRDDLGYVAQRLRSEATGAPLVTAGEEVRVPMAIDGHFWVTGAVDGVPVKFLVDSGATMTTVSRTVADAAEIRISADRNRIVRTGNGLIRVASGRARSVRIATIERRNLGLHVIEDDMNVLGMNFLSSLEGWGVEGRWLVLKP